MRLFSLRRILGLSLLFLALVPALAVTWLMSRGSTEAVEDLAGQILANVAGRVQSETEIQLRHAHDVLDGLLPERPTPEQSARARGWLRGSPQVETMAFALSRQSPVVPSVFWANSAGEYTGVETTPDGVRVAVRGPQGAGRAFYAARDPGDRTRLLQKEAANFEPRSRAWYQGALRAQARAFTPVQVAGDRRQLMVTLSQPLYDADGGAAGVFGVDLYLKELADLLRTQRISSRGAAFVIDERGRLVASSAGDALFRAVGADFERTTPAESANPVIRASFAALRAAEAGRAADSVSSDTALQRLPYQGGSLMMVQRPFAEQLGLRWTLVVAAPEGDFTSDIVRAFRASLGVIAALVAGGVLLAFFVAHGIGSRLRRLTLAAEQLGRGEVPAVDDATRIREIRQLSQVMHDSAGQLQGYRAQVAADAKSLQQANETLEARVEERTRELAASREEALGAARAKAAFLATMSHEIRTPLNGVVGMSTLLAETPLDAEQLDYLQTIRLSSDQLLAVINDILDFSKIESGKLELESEPLAVRGAVEEACDIAAPRAREKGLELIIDIPEASRGGMPEAILGDVTRLRQVLINLINNAVKFTEKGEVAVHARRLGGADDTHAVVEFRVTDTGIGIPQDRASALFEAFTQVDASTTRKYGGTGLGLAICKRLVELMGGEIGVESEPGKGSTFWFTVAAPVAQMLPAFGHGEVGVLRGNRAFVVDDHATNVRILTRQLQLWGMDVASAESGEEALRQLEEAAKAQRLPDVIITDMHMPAMDGVTLARRIREHASLRDVPLVLLSSGFMPAGDASAQLFDARLLKPARQTQLFDTIARCISSDHAGRPKAAPIAPDRKRDITVLVADDNAVNLKVAGAMLLKLGYDVATALDGRQAMEATALAIAREQPFGAILMDLNMPDVDGLQATRQILYTYGDRAPPIIALTAAASQEDRARCEAAGMKDYLTKPLLVAALAQALERWIRVPGAPAQEQVPAELPAPGPAEPLPAPPAAGGPLMDYGRLN
ncbi:MAG: response regulator, partial [Burkholderiaceae bacterium]